MRGKAQHDIDCQQIARSSSVLCLDQYYMVLLAALLSISCFVQDGVKSRNGYIARHHQFQESSATSPWQLGGEIIHGSNQK